MADELFDRLNSLLSAQEPSEFPDAAAFLADIGVPSVSVAVLDNGIISAHSFSTLGNGTDTLYQACSISKPVAGMATMKLIEEGKLQLDDTLPKLLPQDVWEILVNGAHPNQIALLRVITLRHLLSHTSGLSVGGFPGYLPDKPIPSAREILVGRFPANTPRIQVAGLPGQRFTYSGGGITVLQLVLEHADQLPFSEIVQKRVLNPLGMTRSSYAPAEDDQDVAVAYNTGYRPCDVPSHVQPEQAAAGLWTTPSDLLKAVHAMQQSLDPDGGFMGRDLARQMLTEVQAGYGLVWNAPRDPGTGFSHTGSNDPGFRCVAAGFADLKSFAGSEPDSKLTEELPSKSGICVMTNSARGFTAAAKIVRAVSYLKGWPESPGVIGLSFVPLKDLNRKISEEWLDWVGEWKDDSGGIYSISPNPDGRPTVSFGDLQAVQLVPGAIPAAQYLKGRSSIDLVLDGVELALRLGWDDESRVIHVWHGESGSSTTLKKAT